MNNHFHYSKHLILNVNIDSLNINSSVHCALHHPPLLPASLVGSPTTTKLSTVITIDMALSARLQHRPGQLSAPGTVGNAYAKVTINI